ncbi:MAG: 4Fe-4S dicluster domain-containing protein, partial [Pseudomonadota bacterium]|nr:4Fe-4S dicluster domain-containing protein [Pseudomonadota bacterium]
SGEHGDGRSKAELLTVMYGPRLIEAFQEFKRLWDPRGKMNPGKIVWPKPITTDLRYGPQFQPPALDTVFKFPESEYSFTRAAMRCVGVGECRRHERGTMCPSYRATLEEKHSTRGRARLLQEMLEGNPVSEGWKSEAVADSLDLCLSCKGCKHECPVTVDMATYRAEFLYHHYQHKRRPISSYSMGLVHRWAPLASHVPWLINALTQTPGLDAVAKWISGVHHKRQLPKLAGRTFRAQYSSPHRGEVGRGAQFGADGARNAPTPALPLRGREIRAILWVDTFNNYFSPAPLLAAAELLQRFGYEVMPSPTRLCCGRPYYDFGRLKEAKTFLIRCLDSLSPLLDDRTWLVGIEPSCLSVFRDELPGLFPDDARAKHVSERTLTLGAFLQQHGYPDMRLDRELIVHGHCHHKAIFGLDSEAALLNAVSSKVKVLDSGCCGMAGAFGYEKHKYPVSERIANLVLMPAIRQAPPEALIIADGFSCRHQIAQFAGIQAMTLPEALLSATRQ